MKIATGQEVFLKGRVVRARVGDEWPLEMQFVHVALPDGQNLETNVRNLATYTPGEETQPTDTHRELLEARRLLKLAEDALATARSEAYGLRADLNATRELLRAAEARATQAKTDAQQAAARQPLKRK